MLQMVKALYQLYPESRNCHADSRTPATAASRPRRTPPNWPASPAIKVWPLLMIFDGEQLGDLLPVLNKRAEGRDIFNPAASLNANLVSSRWDANDFGCEVSTNILPRWGKSADPAGRNVGRSQSSHIFVSADPAGRNVVRSQSSQIFVSATPAGRNVVRNQSSQIFVSATPAGRNVGRSQSSHIFVSATPAGRNVGRNQSRQIFVSATRAGRNVVRNQSSHIFVSVAPAGRNVGRNQFPELIRMP